MIIYVNNKNIIATPQPSYSVLLDMLGFGYPLFLARFIMSFKNSYRGFLLAWFSDNWSIGNLDISNKFLTLGSLVTFPITTVIYPTFSKFDIKTQSNELNELYRTSVKYSSLILIPFTIFLILFSKQLIHLFFGTSYSLSPYYLSLALLPFLTVGLGAFSVYGLLNSQGDTITTFRLRTIIIILNIVLSTFLTWKWAIPGLLIGQFITSIVGSSLNYYIVNKKYNVSSDLNHVTRVFNSSVITAVITYFITRCLMLSSYLLQVIIGIIIFMLIYSFLAPLFHVFLEQDVSFFRSVIIKHYYLYKILNPYLIFQEKLIRSTYTKKEDYGGKNDT